MKNTYSPDVVAALGDEDKLPTTMSVATLVPEIVPSDLHNSTPLPGLMQSNQRTVLDFSTTPSLPG